MKTGNWLSSLRVLVIALITPFLVWFLLIFMAGSKEQSFDPNPMVQSLVESPQVLGPGQWTHLIGKDGVWQIKKEEGTLTPLENWKPEGERLILLLEAQGPTLASALFHFLKDRDLIKKTIFLSSSDGLLKDLRFHDGNITASSGQAHIIRFHAMKRLKLENLNTINMSAVYLDPKIFAQDLDELAEYFRDHKVAVFVGPVDEPASEELQKKANILLSR